MDRHELHGAWSLSAQCTGGGGTGNIRLTKLSVDPPYQFVHHGSEVLIFFDILSARNCHLDQHNFSNPFRMVSQEDFESVELLGNAFYVIKAINSDHQLN